MEAEENRERLEKLINDPEIASDPGKLQQNWAELEDVRSLVEQLYQRWDELEKRKEEGC